MTYKAENCAYCIEIPQMEPVKLILEWYDLPGAQGIKYCPMCRNVYAEYYCPWIPLTAYE